MKEISQVYEFRILNSCLHTDKRSHFDPILSSTLMTQNQWFHANKAAWLRDHECWTHKSIISYLTSVSFIHHLGLNFNFFKMEIRIVPTLSGCSKN